MNSPILLIVIPTREGLSQHWFTELFRLEGNIEFILVHPPNCQKHPYSDSLILVYNRLLVRSDERLFNG